MPRNLPPVNPGTPDHSGARLAGFLSDQRQRIIADWTAAVHRDRHIVSSEALTHTELTDHIPQLLDDLSDTLCHAANDDINEQSAWTAATHGHMRWEKGYDTSELLREMRDLRSSIIPLLHEFQDANASTPGALRAMIVVHEFLDDSIRTSVEQFIAATERGLGDPIPAKTGNSSAREGRVTPHSEALSSQLTSDS